MADDDHDAGGSEDTDGKGVLRGDCRTRKFSRGSVLGRGVNTCALLIIDMRSARRDCGLEGEAAGVESRSAGRRCLGG